MAVVGVPEDGDVFDPEVIVAEENRNFEASGTDDDTIRKYIEVRRHHYANVFSVGETRPESLAFVLNDLAVWSRAYSPTWNVNQKVQDLMEGRRELYMRIMEITRIPHETQFTRYMDTVVNRQQKV